jgi:hypothetical protein
MFGDILFLEKLGVNCRMPGKVPITRLLGTAPLVAAGLISGSMGVHGPDVPQP